MKAGIKCIAVCVSLCLASRSFAQDPEIKSPAAKDALVRHDRAVDEANAAWARSVKAAINTAITELKTARDTAMRNRNLEDANAIDTAIRGLAAKFDALDFTPFSFTVLATKDWQGSERLKPATYRFTATGRWTNSGRTPPFGPEGQRGDGLGTLQGRVGRQEFFIGPAREIETREEGVLELRMNDSGFEGNSGSVQVTVERIEPQPPRPQAPSRGR